MKGVQESTGMNYFVKYMLGAPNTVRQALLRLVPPVMLMSAFTNNTAIVAMLMPAVSQWATQCNLPISQLLMPLSFAAILGGMCTIIGTSVNLIVSGLALQAFKDGQFRKDNVSDVPTMVLTNGSGGNTTNTDTNLYLSFFEIGLVGLPVCIVGATYMILLAPILLPNSKGLTETIAEEDEEKAKTGTIRQPLVGGGHDNDDSSTSIPTGDFKQWRTKMRVLASKAGQVRCGEVYNNHLHT